VLVELQLEEEEEEEEGLTKVESCQRIINHFINKLPLQQLLLLLLK
jgi:hypothetical protein